MSRLKTFSAVFCMLLGIVLLVHLTFPENDNLHNIKESIASEKAQTQRTNEWAQQVVESNKSRESDDTKDTATQRFLELLAPLSIKEIKFYGLIVDQYGEPVEGVHVDYTGSRSLLASGSGAAQTTTDIGGRFVIRDAKGESLQIRKLSKFGYQFPELDRFFMPRSGPKLERYWSDFNESTPFVIKSWKVDHLPKVIHNRDITVDLKQDGKDNILRFDDEGITKVRDDQQGHVIVNFLRAESSWKLTLKSEQGGYQEAEDYFLYNAPLTGYGSPLIIEGKNIKRKNAKIYFLSNSGRIYGALTLHIRPGLKNETARLRFTYTVNVEGGRSLVLSKKSNNNLL